jgi:hypothetical protein
MTRADLMRALGRHREQVDRLFRLDHNSRLDAMDDAFKAVGVPLRLRDGRFDEILPRPSAGVFFGCVSALAQPHASGAAILWDELFEKSEHSGN